MTMPKPPGAVPVAPLDYEKAGDLQPIFAFQGVYAQSHAQAEVCFTGHVRAYGWRPEHRIVLASRGGVATEVALSFTNATERLSAVLSRMDVRKTSVQYKMEPQK